MVSRPGVFRRACPEPVDGAVSNHTALSTQALQAASQFTPTQGCPGCRSMPAEFLAIESHSLTTPNCGLPPKLSHSGRLAKQQTSHPWRCQLPSTRPLNPESPAPQPQHPTPPTPDPPSPPATPALPPTANTPDHPAKDLGAWSDSVADPTKLPGSRQRQRLRVQASPGRSATPPRSSPHRKAWKRPRRH